RRRRGGGGRDVHPRPPACCWCCAVGLPPRGPAEQRLDGLGAAVRRRAAERVAEPLRPRRSRVPVLRRESPPATVGSPRGSVGRCSMYKADGVSSNRKERGHDLKASLLFYESRSPARARQLVSARNRTPLARSTLRSSQRATLPVTCIVLAMSTS